MDHPALYSLPDQAATNVVRFPGGPEKALHKSDPLNHLYRLIRRLRAWRMGSVAATVKG